METIRDFEPADRYVYDMGRCSCKKGFAQIDTSQDASYFGMWANPFKLAVLTYAEGDVTLQLADSPDEFVHIIRHIRRWNNENGAHGFKGIDPGWPGRPMTTRLAHRFMSLGLGDLLH